MKNLDFFTICILTGLIAHHPTRAHWAENHIFGPTCGGIPVEYGNVPEFHSIVTQCDREPNFCRPLCILSKLGMVNEQGSVMEGKASSVLQQLLPGRLSKKACELSGAFKVCWAAVNFNEPQRTDNGCASYASLLNCFRKSTLMICEGVHGRDVFRETANTPWPSAFIPPQGLPSNGQKLPPQQGYGYGGPNRFTPTPMPVKNAGLGLSQSQAPNYGPRPMQSIPMGQSQGYLQQGPNPRQPIIQGGPGPQRLPNMPIQQPGVPIQNNNNQMSPGLQGQGQYAGTPNNYQSRNAIPPMNNGPQNWNQNQVNRQPLPPNVPMRQPTYQNLPNGQSNYQNLPNRGSPYQTAPLNQFQPKTNGPLNPYGAQQGRGFQSIPNRLQQSQSPNVPFKQVGGQYQSQPPMNYGYPQSQQSFQSPAGYAPRATAQQQMQGRGFNVPPQNQRQGPQQIGQGQGSSYMPQNPGGPMRLPNNQNMANGPQMRHHGRGQGSQMNLGRGIQNMNGQNSQAPPKIDQGSPANNQAMKNAGQGPPTNVGQGPKPSPGQQSITYFEGGEPSPAPQGPPTNVGQGKPPTGSQGPPQNIGQGPKNNKGQSITFFEGGEPPKVPQAPPPNGNQGPKPNPPQSITYFEQEEPKQGPPTNVGQGQPVKAGHHGNRKPHDGPPRGISFVEHEAAASQVPQGPPTNVGQGQPPNDQGRKLKDGPRGLTFVEHAAAPQEPPKNIGQGQPPKVEQGHPANAGQAPQNSPPQNGPGDQNRPNDGNQGPRNGPNDGKSKQISDGIAALAKAHQSLRENAGRSAGDNGQKPMNLPSPPEHPSENQNQQPQQGTHPSQHPADNAGQPEHENVHPHHPSKSKGHAKGHHQS